MVPSQVYSRWRIITAMCAAFVIALSLLAAPAKAEDFDIWIGSTRVTSGNKGDVLGNGTVKYDPSAKKLTLDGAHLTEYYQYGEDKMGIYIDVADFTLEVRGNNTIHTPNGDATVWGIGRGDGGFFKIIGDGSLTITAGNAQKGSYGIGSSGNVIVDGPTLDLRPGKTPKFSVGLWAYGSFVMQSGKITAHANQAGEESDGIASQGAVTLNGGVVDVSSYLGTGAPATDGDWGIWTGGTRINIANADVIAQGKSKAFKKKVVYTGTKPVKVNEQPTAVGAKAWDGTTALGGDLSPYRFVQIGNPPGGGSADGFLTPVLAVLGAVGGLAIIAGIVVALIRSGLIPAHLLPPQLRHMLKI